MQQAPANVLRPKPSKPKCSVTQCMLPDSVVYADDGCKLFDISSKDPAIRQFLLFAASIRMIGGRYQPDDGKIPTRMRILFQTVVTLTTIYVALYDVYHTIILYKAQASVATYLSLVWAVLSIISQIFLYRTQRSQHMFHFFHSLKHLQISDDTSYEQQRNRSIRRNTCRFLFVGFSILLTTAFYAGSFVFGFDTEVLDQSSHFTFYFEQAKYIRVFLVYYNMSVWNIALHSYICLSNVMFWEAHKFNHKIRTLSEPSEEALENLLVIHTKLNACVRQLDRIFKKYAFLLICAIIPSTLFTFALLLTRTSWAGFALCLPVTFYCLYGYYGATLTPASLHEELSKAKAALCTNNVIWVPFRENVNKLAHTLMMHLDQADLGISLWGFALVTKPMILTTVSVMMTCLAFYLELRPKDDDCQCFNATINK